MVMNIAYSLGRRGVRKKNEALVLDDVERERFIFLSG